MLGSVGARLRKILAEVDAGSPKDLGRERQLRALPLEFGVATGTTEAHGFDSFEGLPEQRREGYAAEAFAQGQPDVNGAELHIGWFKDTLTEEQLAVVLTS